MTGLPMAAKPIKIPNITIFILAEVYEPIRNQNEDSNV